MNTVEDCQEQSRTVMVWTGTTRDRLGVGTTARAERQGWQEGVNGGQGRPVGDRGVQKGMGCPKGSSDDIKMAVWRSSKVRTCQYSASGATLARLTSTDGIRKTLHERPVRFEQT